jgi:large subunit ribosomal protein L24
VKEWMMRKVRKGDRVKVIAGNDRGKIGKVLVVYPERNRIIVENVHMITKHQRATQSLREPGIIKREGAIHVSDVLLVCPECGIPTRVGFTVVDGEKMRRCKQCGEIFR